MEKEEFTNHNHDDDASENTSNQPVNNPDINLKKYGIGAEDINAEMEKLKAKPKSKEITGKDLRLKDVQEIPCLVDPFFQQSGLACLGGSSDTGKSSILRQLAISIVTGDPDFLGFKINARSKSVIYISTEDQETETSYLLRRQSQHYPAEQLEGLRFMFHTEDLLNELDSRLTEKAADLIILDCFADVFGNDLKDTQRIRGYLNIYQELAQKHKCLILFLHHTGKRTENLEPSKNNLLSGQGFEAKMRLVVELRVDLNKPAIRHFCIVKGNYLSAIFKKESYVLHFDELNFMFTNTGERVPFEFLSKPVDGDNGKQKYEQAVLLKNEGKSYTEIAAALGFGSKGTVSKLFEKAKKSGWDNVVQGENNDEANDPF